MNDTKKRLTAALLTLLCLALAGCGTSGDAPAASALSCKEIADQVQSAVGFAGLTDAPASYLEKRLLIDAADLDSWVMRRDTSGASPEMILVLQVKPGADQNAVKRAVEEYREEMILQYRDYQPDQVFKLVNSRVMENGARIAWIVSPDAGKAQAALGSGWK